MSFQDLVIPELINLVASKCDLNTLENLCMVSKNIDKIVYSDIKIQKMKEIIPQIFHKYINFNSKYMLNSKNINIGDKYGITGYIDFIRKKDFINETYKTNIVYGFDNNSRFFISVLYNDLINNKLKIVTFFQRYSNDTTYYVSCQNTFILEGWCATHRFTGQQFDTLSKTYEILFKLMNDGIAENAVNSDDKYSYKLA
jgi:hypothetical protein